MTFPNDRAYIVTGPTSGIGRHTALELAKHGMVVLVGRNPAKLSEVKGLIEQRGQQAASVVCDLSEPASVKRAVQEIVALNLPIQGLLNNAGIMQLKATRNTLGWDTTFATNHLGPFALTEALLPYLPDGSNVVFIASGVEDPERKPARAAGFRGGRYISVEASARGEWKPDGSKMLGADAYATSKQCNLATAYTLARENPHLYVNALEPGFSPGSGLGRDANLFLRLLMKYVLSPLAPHIKYWSTPKLAAREAVKVLLNAGKVTGIYFDEVGKPMLGSVQVRDIAFQDRVVAETRDFLESIPA
ncbi:SDR family NAD(P)-dependent oxidoreductase [Rhizobium sp. P44RR-XXIV]|uniref:SDR family NAD(P)-dependent oxidoreductase n=1 Tax=Rhizobium sp. P44RR-XXIV TaxID=1921145 RepID=UPI00098745D4|nr:SDR family NAD(P)-dependent oxidoreductase [Rhizobium sp. P44RR-XXIV]TIX90176.1 SDR family NAD(P)-dependent oxidoreductase [Rhizobium sp. P44RR-XXIV]